MIVKLLNNWKEFEKLENEWNELLINSKADTIFLRWEWINVWREISGKFAQPFIIIVRDSHSNLLGVAPFYISEFLLLRIVSFRTLRILGDYATSSEYPDWIMHKDHENKVAKIIVNALFQYRDKWDCIWMTYVAGWTGTSERIIRLCRQQGFLCMTRPRYFGFIPLPEKVEYFMNGLTRNMRKQIKRQTKAVFCQKDPQIIFCNDLNMLHSFMNSLFKLHHLRWKKLGQEGSFQRKPDQMIFYKKFSQVALEKGWLWLFGLEIDDEYKAVQIGYRYNNIFHQIQEGFDPDFFPGIGNVLRMKIIESCIYEGIQVYDFLGEMSDHKRKWLARERAGYDIFLGHQSIKNRLLFKMKVWPTGRFLKPSFLPRPLSSYKSQ